MDDKKHKLIIDGNAFYELDMECKRKKEEMKKRKQNTGQRKGIKRDNY